MLLTGCARMLAGQPVSVFADPFRVGGLEAIDGLTGLRSDVPAPSREVESTDGGRTDEIAAQSVSDIEQFWEAGYGDTFDGDFRRVKTLISWDAGRLDGTFCDSRTFLLINAAYCSLENTIGWDRLLLMPTLRSTYGDMAITMVLAHVYGHAIARMAGITKRHLSPTLVAEQQADCLAGAYLRWVAQGDSPRFTLSTGDGLNSVLAAMLVLRDPVLHADETIGDDEHGSAFERISAFQFGFTDGTLAGLLTNGLAASDVNGESVPAGFFRIDAYRTGVLGDVDRCAKRFP